MAKHQLQSETYPYASPTTPGLYVTFRAYIIELICLNINPKLGPRFWADPKKWGPKFRQEVKGVYNVAQQLDITDTLIQTALVQIIKNHNIKSLTYKTVAQRVVRSVKKRKADLEEQRIRFGRKQLPQAIDVKKNSTFVDAEEKSALGKIREVENGQKKV
jgi:hypothetical protein